MRARSVVRLAILAGASAAILGAIALLSTEKVLETLCAAVPPSVPPRLDSLPARPVTRDGRTWAGASWLDRRQGIWQMYLEGEPATIGYTAAILTDSLNQVLEDEFIEMIQERIPSKFGLWLVKQYVVARNCALPDYVPAEYLMEMLGATRGFSDRHPEIGPQFDRILGYHAAHDISHFVMDTPFVGCTSFAAWGSHVENGHVLVGRNFDFEAGTGFDRDKIVTCFNPETGNRFVSVGWAGMFGAVTGLNSQHIFISVNGAHSSDDRWDGVPVSFVVRDVLQHASTLEEAVAIIEKAPVFVSDAYLVADGKSNKAVIVEKTPKRTAVVAPDGEYLISANHLRAPVFEHDPDNRDYMASGTSLLRYQRMEELVARDAGTLDVASAADILRDRRGVGDQDIGNGNRASLNALIATHSVIADVSSGVIWVSSYPHQLGAYVPFSVENFGGMPSEAPIPADPFLESGYDTYLESERLLADGERYLEEGRLEAAGVAVLAANKLNPGYFRAEVSLARMAIERGDYREAGDLLSRATLGQPEYLSDREEIASLRAQLDAQAARNR